MKKIVLLLLLLLIPIFRVSASRSSASSYIIMDQNTNRVLLSKDKDSKRLIASISKIMTCILAIESGKMDDIVTVDDNATKAYGSGIYIEVGEKIRLRDLLYGLMLRSGNDAANMIAVYTYGSIDNFVNEMNKKARELGMKNTLFYTPSGLPTPHGNYSSVYDMALLTSYAMKNKNYREIVSTKKYKVTTDRKTYIWNNKNKLLKYDFITGGKTGYTEESGRTLVSSANIDNMNLVVVTIRDSDDWNTHLELYDYVRDNYTSYLVLNKNKFRVLGETYYKNDILYIKNNVYIPLAKKEKRKLISHIILDKKKSYKSGDRIGVNHIYLDNNLIYEEDIYVKKGTKKKRFKVWFK